MEHTCVYPGVEHMTNLEEFWANNNSVEDFKEVKGFYDFILIEIVILMFPRYPS